MSPSHAVDWLEHLSTVALIQSGILEYQQNFCRYYGCGRIWHWVFLRCEAIKYVSYIWCSIIKSILLVLTVLAWQSLHGIWSASTHIRRSSVEQSVSQGMDRWCHSFPYTMVSLFPKEWTDGIIAKIPKKGNLSSPIIPKVILDRIKDHLYSTTDREHQTYNHRAKCWIPFRFASGFL